MSPLRKAFIYNDCSHCHVGSQQVMANLKELLSLYGYSHVSSRRTPRYEDIVDLPTKVAINNASLILVNGEGTMHDNQVPMRRVMMGVDYAKKQGKRVVLLNSLWVDNGKKSKEYLKKFDAICVRDEGSAAQVKRDLGITPKVLPDISLTTRIPDIKEQKRKHDILFEIGFYDKTLLEELVTKESWLEKVRHIDIMRQSSGFISFCLKLARAKTVVTQRFHTVCACILTKTPFVAFEGNTPKIQALMNMADVEIPILTKAEDFQKGFDVAKCDLKQFDKLFRYYEKFDMDFYKREFEGLIR